MKISLIAFGTRGDVQPIVALGKGLCSAGHAVQVVAGHDFGDWVRAHGLGFAPLSVSIRDMMESEDGVAWVEAGDKMAEMRQMKALFAKVGLQGCHDIEAAIQGSDLVIGGPTSDFAAASACEKLGIAYMGAALQPMYPTRAPWATVLPFWPFGGSQLNVLAGKVAGRFLFGVFADVMREYRAELGLPAWSYDTYYKRLSHTPGLCGFSPQVVPPPNDYPSSMKVTGYWFLDDEPGWQPPPDLAAFLERGKPPVYIGFGSMTSGDARAKSNAVMSAIMQSGQRAVVLRGWAGLAGVDGAQTGDDVYFLNSAPHAWLFPRMAGVVHHGGAGTTAAAFRAGVPQFVIPHFADQPYWARRAHELGVAVKPVDKFKLNAQSLADGIKAMVTTPALSENAARLGRLIRAEDGVGEAVRVIGEI